MRTKSQREQKKRMRKGLDNDDYECETKGNTNMITVPSSELSRDGNHDDDNDDLRLRWWNDDDNCDLDDEMMVVIMMMSMIMMTIVMTQA